MRTLFAVLTLWSLAHPAGASPEQLKDEKAVRALADAYAGAWNRGDAAGLAALWTPDGTLFTPDETDVGGRDLIQAVLAKDLGGLFKGTTTAVAVRHLRWVGPGAAAVDLDQFIEGPLMQRLVLAASVTRAGGEWRFAGVRAFIPLPRRDPPSLRLHRRAMPLAGGRTPVVMDYLQVDRRTGRVWVPAGNDGSVDVLEPGAFQPTRVAGFATADAQVMGQPMKVGPSAIALGEGVAYVGNRGDASLCAVDLASLKKGACLSLSKGGGLAGSVDGLAYVAATREVWATMGAPPIGVAPPRPAVTVFDAASPGALALKLSIPLPADPEGYAVDEKHGVFFTNLQDQDRTVAIDVRGHRVLSTWPSGCGPGGPRGLAVDPERGFVFVACTDRVVVLDAGRGGARLAEAPAGQGIDNIDFLPARSQLFVAAGQSGLLTIYGVSAKGELGLLAAAPTAKGARVVVAGNDGTAFVADSAGGQVLAFSPAGP